MLMRLHKIRLGSKGFTLVELMVVVGILGVLGAVAFPMITSTLPNYRLRAAARELVIDFKKAKMEAVKRNRSVLIQFTPETVGDPDNGGFYQMFVDDDGVGGISAGDTLLKTVTMPRNVRLQSNITAGFTNRGLPSNTTGVTLALSDNTKTYTVTRTPAGAVRLQ